MRIILNDSPKDISAETVSGLISELNVTGEFVAVARNDRILARSVWDSENVSEGDRIDIIAPVGGG